MKLLEEYSGNLQRAAVELAKDWRADRVLKTEAMLIAIDSKDLLIISGTGEVIEPMIKLLRLVRGNYAWQLLGP